MSKFSVRDLSALQYANGFTMWHYKHGAATLGECQTDGFFNDAGEMMAVGDAILITGPEGGRQFVVRAAAHGRVDLGPIAP